MESHTKSDATEDISNTIAWWDSSLDERAMADSDLYIGRANRRTAGPATAARAGAVGSSSIDSIQYARQFIPSRPVTRTATARYAAPQLPAEFGATSPSSCASTVPPLQRVSPVTYTQMCWRSLQGGSPCANEGRVAASAAQHARTC
jgi:hypothetical protein